ncbi:MAG: hypothetical protein AVDCRST_MAG49-3584 [uncultured Thermomicrobiales bacterium]|uniref:Uncharacterized protein n=1 Tax=uncultured Thermomicrobiales bacterium TaxID=1645740 RepID=A0A6J4V9F1_9BACT|nr:MAG: hypothetical protein AVDCRST_MAG49-3584 [uncultured Thermomicrobiales bacterium]
MLGLLGAVFGLALVDSVNPSAIAVTLYLLLTVKTYTPRVLTYVGAVFGTYFVLGALLMLGLGAVLGRLGSVFDGSEAHAAQGVVGAAMLAYGIFAPSGPRAGGAPAATPRPRSDSPGAVFLLGVTISVVEFSTAVPYLGAIGLLTEADLGVARWLPILAVYNLILVSPPLALLAAYRVAGPRLRGRLEHLRARLERGAKGAWLTILAIVGFLLLANSLRYFDVFGLVEP